MTDRTRKILKWLRIAWTGCCGVAAVLIIAFWIKSHFRRDVLSGTILSHVCVLESLNGEVACMAYYLNPAYTAEAFGWESYGPTSKGYGIRINGNVVVRHGALLMLCVFFAAMPWLTSVPKLTKGKI